VKKLLTTSLLSLFSLVTIPVAADTQSPRLGSCANLMPLGDSITLGVNGGYRNDLFIKLQQDNCGVTFVGTQYDSNTRAADKDHEGHSGFTIADVSREVAGWVSAAQPDVVTLMIGTNDTAWWTAESAEQIGARHNALVEQIQKIRPNVWIFVASIAPQSSHIIAPNNVDRAALTSQFNAVVRRNIEARANAGQKVRFVDVNSVLTVGDLYDGVHPTEAAHAKVANKFVDAIRAEFAWAPATTTPAPTPTPAPAPVQADPPAVAPAAAASTPASEASSALAASVTPTAGSSSSGGGGSIGFPILLALLALGISPKTARLISLPVLVDSRSRVRLLRATR
jgi:lysophospholipase L1-like esterase